MIAAPSGVERWVHSEVLRRALIDAARTLAPVGVELLAIKGIFLVCALGVDPAARRMVDADAVVVRGSFRRAVRTLSRSADWTVSTGWSAKVATQRTGGSIDLHRMPLPPFFGAMHSSALRRRASRHPAFDGLVLVPEATDAAALAVAHFVKDCLGLRSGHGLLARDLERLRELAGLQPGPLKERLQDHRLRSVGLVAFTRLADLDPTWRPWLDAMSPSRVDRVRARLVVDFLCQYAESHPDLAFLLVRGLGDDPVRSASGVAATAARLARDQVWRLWSGVTS